MSDSRTDILRAASRLFAERGYAAVSVRDIAAAAQVSPALVIKLAGSKDELFRSAVGFETDHLELDVPDEDLARALVERVVDRAVAVAPDPLVRAVVLLLPAPDPQAVRESFAAAYLEPVTRRLGGGDEARRRAELALASLVGLAVAVRVLKQPLPTQETRDALVSAYEPAVRAMLFPAQA